MIMYIRNNKNIPKKKKGFLSLQIFEAHKNIKRHAIVMP